MKSFPKTNCTAQLLGAVLFSLAVAAGAAAELSQQDIFVGGQDGYRTYRIPSLLVTKKGTLLAFCEGRKNGPGDSGDIDLLLKRSTDSGKTWSSQQVIWDDAANTCGNPCAVVDQKTGTVVLLATHNPGTANEKQISGKKATASRTVWLLQSTDDGSTWSKPLDITASVKDRLWGWYATGPGVGIQIQQGRHKGRLVIPCDHSSDAPDSADGSGFIRGAHVIYSDGRGKNWHLGGVVRPDMNECQVVELADGKGTLMLSMRNYLNQKHRAHAISQDGGETWSSVVLDSQLPDPVCQASILRYDWPRRKQPGRILFSNPAGPRRENLTVRLSDDDGQTWPVSEVLYAKPSAYSCLAVLPDQTIGCLFECGTSGPYERISLARFPISWLKSSTP